MGLSSLVYTHCDLDTKDWQGSIWVMHIEEQDGLEMEETDGGVVCDYLFLTEVR